MNPYLVFCLYVAARVLVQYVKTAPQDGEAKTSLEFLLTAMAALRKKVPLAESFMIQLQLDIEGNGLDILLHNPDFSSIVKEKAVGASHVVFLPKLTLFQSAHTMRCANLSELRDGRARDKDGRPIYVGEPTGIKTANPVYTREPHDFRVPDTWRSQPDKSPPPSSLQSEGRTQTSYALGNIQLNARENASTYPYTPGDAIPEPQAIHGILPGRMTWGWSSNESVLQGNEHDLNIPVGMNPIINNNIANNNAFETDVSDQTPISRHNSTGLTPQSSNSAYQSSSNTSYSPPTVLEEDDPLTSATGVSSAAQPSISAALEDSFKVPPGWETGGTGMTPGFMGMSPGSAEWEKMMQGINWDGTTGMTPK